MNSFFAGYNPMDAFRGGYDLGDAMTATAERERQRLITEKERAALSQMGQGGYLAGLEGVQGAVRPDWLKQLYQDNPHEAMKQEQLVSSPFLQDREIRKMGEIERAKRQADLDVAMPMMNAFFKARGGSSPQATDARAMPSSMPLGEGGAPVNAFAGGPMPEQNFSDLSGDEPSFEMTPQGFKFGVKSASPLDSAIKVADVNLRKADQQLKGKEYDLKVEDQIIKKAQAADQFDKSRFDKVDAIHKQENDLKKQIDTLKMQKSGGDISPADYIESANRILADLKDLGAQKKSLLQTQSTAQETLGINGDQYRNPSSTEAQPVIPKTSATTTAPAPTSSQTSPPMRPGKAASDSSSIGSGLPYKQAVEVQREKLKGDIGQTRKIVDTAQEAANSALQHKPATDRIMELLQKNDVGRRILKLPGGTTAATIVSGNYDELNKWRNSLIDMDRKEGTSGEYNTIPELRIHSESLPAVDNDENTNRRAIVSVKNILEARLVAPQFLETWAKQHGGTLDGARQEFRSWMQHNPMYQTSEKNGAVSIQENPHYVPLDIWTRLRQRLSEKDILAKQKSGGIQVLNGRVFFKE